MSWTIYFANSIKNENRVKKKNTMAKYNFDFYYFGYGRFGFK